MTTFDNREKAEEAAFAAHESSEFAVRARRDLLVGHWAADLLGLKDDEAQAYAKSLVSSDVEKPSDGDLIAKLNKDFAAKGVKVSLDLIVKTLAEKTMQARNQLIAGQK